MGRPAAIVVGVGAEKGLGAALCRRFAEGGHHVFVAGRTAARVEQVAQSIRDAGNSAEAVVVDATSEDEVIRLFDRATGPGNAHGPVDLVAYNAGNNQRIPFRDISARLFEEFWRVGCLGGFLVGREAARHLVPQGRGTVLFTGASGSLRGKSGFAQFAAAKAGLRMVSQSMAREFGPMGLHVAHVVIDGGISGERLLSRWPERAAEAGADGLLEIAAIAETFWQIHCQPRSAWTQEIDLRPYREQF
ncbi:MAG: SDR family NAD(P)-dependent oxidoreductase [Betaproteobacteria bacterium]